MESKNELQTNKKGKGSIIVIIILILLVLALSGYICYDKFLSKEDNTKVTNNDSNAKETDVTSNEDNNTVAEKDVTNNSEEKDVTNSEENNNKKYVNKVYANANIDYYMVLFDDGKCVCASSYSYTSVCDYYIEDNKIFVARSSIGARKDNTKTNEVFVIYNDSNNQEHINLENSNDQNSALKYLK